MANIPQAPIEPFFLANPQLYGTNPGLLIRQARFPFFLHIYNLNHLDIEHHHLLSKQFYTSHPLKAP